ncbi:MAG: hypothetical protein FWE22_04220 [Firmicutes bacterium]|nr:hypothetical protein [Bacillota bacterium]
MFGLFKKKDRQITVAQNKQVIEDNVKKLDSLFIVFDGREEILAKLTELKTEYEFASPKENASSHKVDLKIGELLKDTELAAQRVMRGGSETEVLTLIQRARVEVTKR